MRTVQSILLFGFCLGLTMLFQNCGGAKPTAMEKSLASSDPSALASLHSVEKTATVSESVATLDLAGLLTPIARFEFAISPQNSDLSNATIAIMVDPNAASNITYRTRANVCDATVASSPETDWTSGLFIRSSTREIFVISTGSVGTVESGVLVPTQIQFAVTVRPSGMSTTTFEGVFCNSGAPSQKN